MVKESNIYRALIIITSLSYLIPGCLVLKTTNTECSPIFLYTLSIVINSGIIILINTCTMLNYIKDRFLIAGLIIGMICSTCVNAIYLLIHNEFLSNPNCFELSLYYKISTSAAGLFVVLWLIIGIFVKIYYKCIKKDNNHLQYNSLHYTEIKDKSHIAT